MQITAHHSTQTGATPQSWDPQDLDLPCLMQTFVKWQWNVVTSGGKY